MLSILAEADEKYDRYYELKSRGYDLKHIQMRVKEILGVDGDLIYSRGRRRKQVKARSLFLLLGGARVVVQFNGFGNTARDDAAGRWVCCQQG